MKHLRPYFKALCDDHRLEIIGLLIEREHCLCELIEKLNLSQATVSYHAKVLYDAELTTFRQHGKSTFYSIDKEGFKRYAAQINVKLFKPIEESNPGESNLYENKCKIR